MVWISFVSWSYPSQAGKQSQQCDLAGPRGVTGSLCPALSVRSPLCLAIRPEWSMLRETIAAYLRYYLKNARLRQQNGGNPFRNVTDTEAPTPETKAGRVIAFNHRPPEPQRRKEAKKFAVQLDDLSWWRDISSSIRGGNLQKWITLAHKLSKRQELNCETGVLKTYVKHSGGRFIRARTIIMKFRIPFRVAKSQRKWIKKFDLLHIANKDIDERNIRRINKIK